MDHNRTQVLNTLETLHQILKHSIIFRTQKSADEIMPLVYHVVFGTGTYEMLS